MLSIHHFDTRHAQNTGGVTGSRRVLHTEENHPYQLKNSIRDAKAIRRIKAGGTDRENFGEVIAANIGYAFLGYNKIPKVQLVYDDQRQRVLIASKYLQSIDAPPCTLDEHLAAAAHLPESAKHIKIVSKYADDHPGHIRVDADEVKALLPSLTKAIAISMLTGDHDINPGNMLVIHEGEPPQPAVSRIDFGHAFNDLLNAPSAFGGGIINHAHPSMDFFNRKAVAGFPNEAQSKFWRDYPGLIPSQELVDAIRDIAFDGNEKLERGIENAQKEFELLLEQQRQQGDYVGVQHTVTSLKAIYENYTGKELDLPDERREREVNMFVNVVFSSIGENINDHLADMQRTADILEMQVKIDKMIEFEKMNVSKPREEYQEILDEMKEGITQQYHELDPDHAGIEWIKTEANEPAFHGTLDHYIDHRKPILGELIAKMQKRLDDYANRIDNQVFSTVREGIRKKMDIQRGVMDCMHSLNHGDLDGALEKMERLKQTFRETYGESTLLGLQKSAGYEVIEQLERDIKLAQAAVQNVDEPEREHVIEAI